MDNDDDGQLSLRRRLNKETDVGMYSFFVARRPSDRPFVRSLPYLQNVPLTTATEITPEEETSPSPSLLVTMAEGEDASRGGEGRSSDFDSVRILTDATTGDTRLRTDERRRRSERAYARAHSSWSSSSS